MMEDIGNDVPLLTVQDQLHSAVSEPAGYVSCADRSMHKTTALAIALKADRRPRDFAASVAALSCYLMSLMPGPLSA